MIWIRRPCKFCSTTTSVRRSPRSAMPELLIATAFLAGLMGSAHCVAMCGGIATALGTVRGGTAPVWHTLLYQLGRISSYGLIGGLAGTLGAAVGLGFEASRWSGVLRIATA